jgi:hypothetical protein
VLRKYSVTALLPIGAAALLAMTAGHALVLALAPATGYRHGAQTPALEMAVALAIAAVIAAIRRVVHALRRQRPQPDWALPSLTTIRALGIPRVAIAVVSLQTIALFVGESLERHAAGLPIGGFAELVGSAWLFAPFVHLAIGAIASVALISTARAVCAHVAAAIALVCAVLAWLSPLPRAFALTLQQNVFAIVGPQRHPIAHNLANRPPPAFGRLA